MLTLSQVYKSYGSTVAINGLDLEIRSGEIFGLLGPNGAGKSTAVHLAVGLLAPDRGTVSVGTLGSPRDPKVRAHLGVAPQALALYERLSGAENLRFFGRVYRISGAKLAASIAAALDFVGLGDRQHDAVGSYSGGMKRRLNLAAAVLHDPEVILLDEPTVGVDPQSRNLILDNILKLKARGRTVVYTTHYMEEAARLCDRVAIMDHGRLLAIDTVAGLLRAHGGKPTLVAEIGDAERRIETDDPLATLQDLAREHQIGAFHVERTTLEQVFLRLTGRRLRD